MPKTMIDERLFAHINTDPFLLGSFKLQGNRFANTIGYLSEYMEKYQRDGGAISEEIHKLLSACSQLTVYENTLTQLSSDTRNTLTQLSSDTRNTLKPTIDHIKEKILDLKTGGYLLVPGGWSTQDGGHALIYEFKKDSDGSILFTVHNSGAGLEYHAKRSDKEKELFSPTLTYKIPENSINSEHFIPFMNELLALQIPKIHKKATITAEYLYETVLAKLSYLKATLIPPVVSEDKWYTAGQQSGTCTQHSLHAMLKARFSSLDDYRKFIYHFKAHSLDEYISLLRTNTSSPRLNEAKYQSQIEKAIRHQLRILNVNSASVATEHLFSLEEKKREAAKLLGYLSELRSIKQETAIPRIATSLPTVKSIHFSEPLKPQIGKLSDFKEENIEPILIVKGGENLFKEMEVLLERCKKLESTDQHMALFEQLEHFIIHMPLPKPPKPLSSELEPFYKGIKNEEDLMVFYKSMNALQDLYFKSGEVLLGGANQVLPRMYTVKLSICALTSHINATFKLNSTESSKTSSSLSDFNTAIAGILSDLNSKEFPNNLVYLATDDPTLDTKYKELVRISESPMKDRDFDMRIYYQEIINSFPALKDKLEKLYKDAQLRLGSYRLKENEWTRNGLTSLHYFLTNFDNLKSDNIFKPLIDKFNLQDEMEVLLSFYTARLKYDTKLKEERIKPSILQLSTFSTNRNRLKASECLQLNKYGIAPTDGVLDPDSFRVRPDNVTQLVPKETLYLEKRELFHLRRFSSVQIPLTLDYFKIHLEKLSRKDMQIYVEANLFQPNLLLDLLNTGNASLFFKQFDSFIKSGLKHYAKKGLLTEHSLFFIRMAYLVNQYASKLDATRFGDRLSTFNDTLTGYISCNSDSNIKTVLHKYRFLSLAQPNKDNFDSLPLFLDSLTSYFYIQAHDNSKHSLDVDSRFQLHCAEHSYKRIIYKNKEAISLDRLIKLLKELNINIEDKEGISLDNTKYPIYQIKSEGEVLYAINLQQGLIFKGDYAYSATPLDILNHPIATKFGLKDKVSSLISTDGKVILFDTPPNTVRFIKNDTSSYRIQKLWPDSKGINKWYELSASSPEQEQFWNLDNESDIKGISKCLKERDNLFWKSLDDETFLISNEKNEISYEGISNQISPKDSALRLCPNRTTCHRELALIEHPEYISVWEKSDAEGFVINLDRYGLRLTKSSLTEPMNLNFEGTDYQMLPHKTPLGDGIVQLVFENKDQKLLILPIQPFIIGNKRSERSEYYSLTQDIFGVIPHSIVAKIIGSDPQSWQYSGTEKFIALKMEAGRPVPTTSEEALYLCYLYLGSNQPEKAWEILEFCDKKLGGMAGTYQELQYLNWIVSALPYQLSDKDSEAIIVNPHYVACKLKAMSLFTKFSNLDKEISMPKPQLDEKTVNGKFERKQIQNTDSFRNSINEHIYELFSKLQALRRELPAEFTLNDLELKSLLDYYYKNTPRIKGKPSAIGALGYESVQLNLRILKKEWDSLVAKASLSEYEQGRKEDIERFLQEHKGVVKTRSKLQYLPIDLSLPNSAKINSSVPTYAYYYDQSSYEKQIIEKNSTLESQAKALKDLTLDMTDTQLINNLSDYIKIATSTDSVNKVKLLEFCTATLIASRHTKPINNLALICNVLYRLTNGASLPTYIKSFDYLIDYARELNPKPINIPQLYDDTKEILISAEDLWLSIPEEKPSINPHILSHTATPRVRPWLSTDILSIKTEWQRIEDKFNLVGDLKSEDENSAGVIQFAALKELKECAQNHFNPSTIEKITKDNAAKINELKEEQELAKNELIALANEGPEDPLLKQQWAIDRASGKLQPLDLQHILTLYFHADTARYKQKTGLEEGKINLLHDKLITFVAKALQLQQCERVSEQLEALTQKRDEGRSELLFSLARTLFAENHIDGVAEPALSLFQYNEGILLRPQQQKALERLLKTNDKGGYDESVEKIIMGGGKSKVILPTLAQKKATGSNLVIIEVPQALLRTNYIDLKANSSTLFDQNAFLFEFNRDSDCSIERLEQLYNQLTATMVNKDYLVTTKDALQSLELKYLELLLTSPSIEGKKEQEVISEWEKQVLLMERLVLLFKNRGDLIIDEVHQGLLLKSKLNYTIGQANPISKDILTYSLGLYQFLAKVTIKDTNLQAALDARKPLSAPNLIEEAMKKLAQGLIEDESSPLYQEIKLWLKSKPQDKEIIYDYLLNNSDSIPEYIKTGRKEIQEQFAFYKEQIAHILPFTLKRNQGEHYGPSKATNKTPAEQMIAIPYMANNVPNERSHFANYLESINYTIQSTQIAGISIELLTSALDDWINEARAELTEKALKNIDETSVAARFRAIVQGYDLQFSELDLDDKEQLRLLHSHLSHNKALIFKLLETQILPLIKSNDTILHSDAYAHVDLVRSCQGMSGTPTNHPTFHQRLHFSKDSAKGTDSFILKTIMAKESKIYGVDFKNTSECISSIFSKFNAEDKARTIIDISARFKGIANINVALDLAKYIQTNKEKFSQPSPLKYVLFFNEKNELSALRIQEDIENQKPIVIGSSDPKIIDSRLNSKPGERFTYYDQAHTVGADIKQDPHSKGIVLIDQETDFQSFLQGSMRMRALLEGSQSIDLIVPEALAHKTLDDIAVIMQTNEARQLKQDNFNAAQAKMTNIIRTNLMHRLLSIKGEGCISKKHQFLNKMRSYFIEVQSSDFYSRFGGIDTIKSTKQVLEELKEGLEKNWRSLLAESEDPITSDEERGIKEELNLIIESALVEGTCEPSQKYSNSSLGTDVEVEQEMISEVEVLTMKEEQQEQYSAIKTPEEYISIKKWMGFMAGDGNAPELNPNFKDLHSICKTTGAPYTPDFSPNIYASQNFYMTFKDQKKYIGVYLKPVHALMFTKEQGVLKCCLLTQAECEEMYDLVSKQTDGTRWISTTQHTILAGTPFKGFDESEEYQTMIEQIQYFNGEFNLLAHSEYHLNWLASNSKEKLDYYARYLWPCHENSVSDFSEVKAQCSVYKKAASFISNAPWEDYRDYDWIKHFPGCEEKDAEKFKKLALIFYEVTKQWKEGVGFLSIDNIKSEYGISPHNLSAVTHYVKQLDTLKVLFKEFEQAQIKAKTTDAELDWEPLLTVIDKTSKTVDLLKVLPPIITQAKENKPSEVLYDALCAMMEIPPCKNHPFLLRILASSPHIKEPLIGKVLQECAKNKVALSAFLNNLSEPNILSILKQSSDVSILNNLAEDTLLKALNHYLNIPDINNNQTHKIDMEIKNNLIVQLVSPLFKQLEESRYWIDDEILNEFIVTNLKKMYDISSETDYQSYKKNIENAIEIMQSPEVFAINKTIDRLRNEKPSFFGGFFYRSGKEKAMRIERAMLAVPIDERSNILNGTSEAVIKVQEALAEHRNKVSAYIKGKAKHADGKKVATKGTASSYKNYNKLITEYKTHKEDFHKNTKPEVIAKSKHKK